MKAETPEGREGFDREAQPGAGIHPTPSPSPFHGEGSKTPSPSSAAPLPHPQNLTPQPPLQEARGSEIPAWVKTFWDGATTEQLQHLLQKYGEGRLMAAQERARRAKGVVNPPGFALHLLENNLVAVDVWNGAPDEDADTQPDVIEPVEGDEDATDEQFVIPEDVRQAWAAVLAQLEAQFDRAQFESCIRGARVVAVDGDVLVVEARSVYARDMLAGRMYRDVRRVVRDAMRNQTVIKFVVKGEDWRENAQEAEAA